MNLNFTKTINTAIRVAFMVLLGSSSFAQDLVITADICGPAATEVRMTGPFWGWDPSAGPVAVSNGNGTWTFTLSPAPTADMEYLLIKDGVQENLIADMQNGGTCAPVTDYSTYANRKWVVGSGDVTGISYDRCVPCSYPDLVITTEVCDSSGAQVNLTGPLWGWNPAFGPQGVNNGDGTWTITLSPVPTDSLEFLLVKDGVMEDLVPAMVNGGTCAPITDYNAYANRLWALGQPATFTNTYGLCISCASLSIDENELSPISVYPNPSSSVVTVSREYNIEKITVYSVVGEKVMERVVDTNEATVDLSNLAPGVYQLVAEGGNIISRSQIIKE